MNTMRKTNQAFAVLAVVMLAFASVGVVALTIADDADAAEQTTGTGAAYVDVRYSETWTLTSSSGYPEFNRVENVEVSNSNNGLTADAAAVYDTDEDCIVCTVTVSGTPQRAVTTTFEIRVNYSYLDDNDEPQTSFEVFTVTIDVQPATAYTGVTIDSVGGTDATVGYEYSYTVQTTPSDATVTISGNASNWLSVSDHTIKGTPLTAGSYTLTITAEKDGYTATETVVIVVSAVATSEGAPTINSLTYAIDPLNPYRITFSVSASNASSITIDYGDGESNTGATTTHTYTQSGPYTVTARAANSNGTVSESISILLVDSVPNEYVAFNDQYTFTLGIDTTGQSVSVTGCPFLYVTVGSNYVTVYGTPESTAYVGETYTVVLTVGTISMTWQLTVDPGSTYPVAGFTYEMSGRTVTITSTASNADTVEYDFGDGHTAVNNSKTVVYTYDDDGDYVITQTVSATVGGQTPTSKYTAMVTAQGDDDDSTMAIIAAICVVLGLIVLVAGLWTRNVWIAVIGVILMIAGAALYLL